MVSVETRWNQHKSAARNYSPDDNVYLYRSMNAHGIENFSIKVLYHAFSNSLDTLIEMLNYMETRCIDKYSSLIPNGYNMTNGGRTFSIYSTTPICMVDSDGCVIKHFNSIRNAYFDTGIDEKLISHACRSKSHYGGGYFWYYYEPNSNLEIGDNLGKHQKGKTSWKGKNKGIKPPVDNRKQINQYSKSGELIATYNSAKDAASAMGVSRTSISNCASGWSKTAAGFIWKYI